MWSAEGTFVGLVNESRISTARIGALTEHEAQHMHELEETMQSFIEQYVHELEEWLDEERQHVYELEEEMESLIKGYAQLSQGYNDMALHLQMQNIIITGQGLYLVQLIEVLEANNINVPEPDMKDRSPTPADP